MRKSLTALFLVLSFMLAACSKGKLEESDDQILKNDSLDRVKKGDFIVFEDGKITSGQLLWEDFIKKTDKGETASVSLAYYYTLGEPSQYSEEYYESVKDNYPRLFTKDLSYDGKIYMIEEAEDGQKQSKEYKFLMRYEEVPDSTSALYSKCIYYVLVNDDAVTWKDIFNGMISSRLDAGIDHYLIYYDYIRK
ncbi:hypothetical protein R2R35_20150 [Anaerocolumna sp. AGMB13020]|uniref:hypothetical protein n=1 Tax=Anaerocolumna sp. AGMB13020 TaxID=3081750 RepID=UPI002954B593|nr:hypothetical protein [Anaerocolumna sp. AGMB13020]WOO36086.1 hypothetical protein R2R35_20150 [Anaerocolumna sp. AGMB13020]